VEEVENFVTQTGLPVRVRTEESRGGGFWGQATMENDETNPIPFSDGCAQSQSLPASSGVRGRESPEEVRTRSPDRKLPRGIGAGLVEFG
jgi:hypothetical protein